LTLLLYYANNRICLLTCDTSNRKEKILSYYHFKERTGNRGICFQYPEKTEDGAWTAIAFRHGLSVEEAKEKYELAGVLRLQA
jgi:hypothetical protein